jgi:hypothetical protein
MVYSALFCPLDQEGKLKELECAGKLFLNGIYTQMNRNLLYLEEFCEYIDNPQS